MKNEGSLACPVCGKELSFRIARGRKSGKPFLMVACLVDGRHFRGFVGDQNYVKQVLNRIGETKGN